MTEHRQRRVVIALGGNAISPPGSSSEIARQFSHTRTSLKGLVQLLKRNYLMAIVHGNGPQVGAALHRVELARDELPNVPLGLLVADTEGSMGYMIEQSLMNLLLTEHIKRDVVTMITQVLVNRYDPALKKPTKFIGSSYPKTEADLMIQKESWDMKPYNNSGHYRRVVGSPKPLSIINARIIRKLIDEGSILITCGGGGIPVYIDESGHYEGVDAVIDKDLAAAILAQEIAAEELFILTNISGVRINFEQPDEQTLTTVNVAELKGYYQAGHFPAGSMGPKIEAALHFLENGGKRVIICDLEDIEQAIHNQAGTQIVP